MCKQMVFLRAGKGANAGNGATTAKVLAPEVRFGARRWATGAPRF